MNKKEGSVYSQVVSCVQFQNNEKFYYMFLFFVFLEKKMSHFKGHTNCIKKKENFHFMLILCFLSMHLLILSKRHLILNFKYGSTDMFIRIFIV